MNPYWGVNFFKFFWVVVKRLYIWEGPLVGDEVQLGVLCALSLASGLLGCFLVLRQMTMLANSLSHTILLGIVGAFVLLGGGSMDQMGMGVLVLGALLSAALTSGLTEFLIRALRVQKDAAIGFVFTTLFALGIVMVTLYTNHAHIGIEAIMGNVDALHVHDLKLAGGLALGVVVLIGLFYGPLKVLTFDPLFARGMGVRGLPAMLTLMTAGLSIGAFRAVGVVLFLALLVGPPLIARRLTNQLGKMLSLSCVIGMVLSIVAVALSRHCLSVYHMPLSTAGLLVTLLLLVYGVTLFATRKKEAYA